MTLKNHVFKRIELIVVISFLFIGSIIADDYYLGDGMKGKRLAVFQPEYVNLTTLEKAVIPNLVNIIRMDLHDYAGFVIVDAQNLEEIQNLQAKSEEESYASTSSLRAGLLQFAEYEAFVKVAKSSGKYSLSLSITDLTTGISKADHTVTSITSPNDIEETAVSKLIANIIPKLGIELTAMGRFALRGGDTLSLSTEQKAEFAKQETNNLKNSLIELEKEIKKYSSLQQLDQNSIAAKAQLEAEKQITEQKLLMAQQKSLRLEQQQEKELKDKMAAVSRTAKANEMIRSMSNQVEKIAHQIRENDFISMNFMQQIVVIEKEKRTYLDIQKKIEEEITKLHSENLIEYEKNKKNVDDINIYSPNEIDKNTGEPFAHAKTSFIKENEKLLEELKLEEKRNSDLLRATSDKQLKEIYKDISVKESKLGKKQSINSIAVEDLFNVGNWHLDKKVWDAEVNIIIDGASYLKDSIEIDFSELCKLINNKQYSENDMNGENGRTADYLDFLDTVAAFESMFRMGTPFVYLEADFNVVPLDKNNPSQYQIKAIQYRLRYTKTNKIIHTYVPENSTSIIKLNPSYDIRTRKEIEDYKKSLVREEKKISKKQKTYYVKNFNKSVFGAYGFFANGVIPAGGGGLKFDYPFDGTNFYFGYAIEDMGILPENTKYGVLDAFIYLGMDYILNFGIHPCVYTQIGYGATCFKDFEDNLDGSMLVIASLGMDMPLNSSIGMFAQYDFFWSLDFGFFDRYVAGLEFMYK